MLSDANEIAALKQAVVACGQLQVGLFPEQYDEFI
jgi:hypothetical protein